MPTPMTQEWLDQVEEAAIDPEQRIVDPHHHLWPVGAGVPYGLAELTADTTSGHAVEHTVFVECGAGYRTDGPDHLKPTGETEFVAGEAARDPNHLIAASSRTPTSPTPSISTKRSTCTPRSATACSAAFATPARATRIPRS